MPSLTYLRVDEPYILSLAEDVCPEPGPDEVLLAARRSLISTGSELRRYRRYEGYDAYTYPVTDLGYSMVGHVIAAGANVAVQLGDRYVAVQRHATRVLTRVDVDEVRSAVRVPDGVSDEEATFGPLLRSTLNWLRLAAIEVTHTVVVIGQGLVGALLMQAARLHSPRLLIATDTYKLRLELARACGADAVIDAARDDPVGAVRELTAGRGADVVIETVGGAHVESFTQALRMAATGGRIVLVGMHTRPLSVPVHTMHDKTVIGSSIGYDCSPGIFRRGLDLVAHGRIRVAPLITHQFPYRQAAEAYRLLDEHPDQALGVILEWDEA